MQISERYMTIRIEEDTIYLIEETYGIELDKVRLNRVTRATFLQFHQFFENRHRLMPIVIKNEKKFLAIVKELLPHDKPIKGLVQRLNEDHILLDISKNIDNVTMKLSKEKKILPNIRVLFENV